MRKCVKRDCTHWINIIIYKKRRLCNPLRQILKEWKIYNAFPHHVGQQSFKCVYAAERSIQFWFWKISSKEKKKPFPIFCTNRTNFDVSCMWCFLENAGHLNKNMHCNFFKDWRFFLDFVKEWSLFHLLKIGCLNHGRSHSSGPPGSPCSSSLVLKLERRVGSTECTSTSSLSSPPEYFNSPGSKKLVKVESGKLKEEVVAMTDIGGYDV